jgi:hypothetical protein
MFHRGQNNVARRWVRSLLPNLVKESYLLAQISAGLYSLLPDQIAHIVADLLLRLVVFFWLSTRCKSPL